MVRISYHVPVPRYIMCSCCYSYGTTPNDKQNNQCRSRVFIQCRMVCTRQCCCCSCTDEGGRKVLMVRRIRYECVRVQQAARGGFVFMSCLAFIYEQFTSSLSRGGPLHRFAVSFATARRLKGARPGLLRSRFTRGQGTTPPFPTSCLSRPLPCLQSAGNLAQPAARQCPIVCKYGRKFKDRCYIHIKNKQPLHFRPDTKTRRAERGTRSKCQVPKNTKYMKI